MPIPHKLSLFILAWESRRRGLLNLQQGIKAGMFLQKKENIENMTIEYCKNFFVDVLSAACLLSNLLSTNCTIL